MRKHYIYILKDPRDQSVRYVGCSVDPQQRYKQHLTPMWGPFSEEKVRWTLELRSLNLKPELEVIDQAESKEDGREKENYWILHYAKAGAELLNSACVWERQHPLLDVLVLRQLQTHMHLTANEVLNLAMRKLAEEVGLACDMEEEYCG